MFLITFLALSISFGTNKTNFNTNTYKKIKMQLTLYKSKEFVRGNSRASEIDKF